MKYATPSSETKTREEYLEDRYNPYIYLSIPLSVSLVLQYTHRSVGCCPYYQLILRIGFPTVALFAIAAEESKYWNGIGYGPRSYFP